MTSVMKELTSKICPITKDFITFISVVSSLRFSQSDIHFHYDFHFGDIRSRLKLNVIVFYILLEKEISEPI